MLGVEPSLLRAHEAYLAAINANDLEAVLAMLTDDAIYLPPHEPAVEGKAAIRPWIEGYFGAYRTHWDKETLELVAAGDWAMERAAERVKDTPRDGGAAVEDVCKGIIIYCRQADGTWKVARDMWNSDRAAAGA
jgi:ketosteroid isomerase-like protein